MRSARTQLALLGLAGVVVCVLGFVAAARRLPEWRSGPIPDEAVFVTRLKALASEAGFSLVEDPRLRLRSAHWLSEEIRIEHGDRTYRFLGRDAPDWLVRRGRGPFVEVSVQARRNRSVSQGELQMLFSTRGDLVSAAWIAELFGRRDPGLDAIRLDLMRVMGAGAPDSPGAGTADLFGQTLHVAPLASSPAAGPSLDEASVGATITSSQTVYVQRFSGSAQELRAKLEGITILAYVKANLPAIITKSLMYFGTFVLFVVLLVQRRIDLSKGVLLAVASMLLSVSDPIRTSTSGLALADGLFDVLGKGIGLFVLWSSAESWIRSTLPGFRTSLDSLRAGHLGPRAGNALLAGTSVGALLAGYSLLATTIATWIPGFIPRTSTVRLPVFGTHVSPIDEGAILTAAVLVAICASIRLPLIRRIPGSALLIAGAIAASQVQVTSYPIAVATALPFVAVLLWTYKRFGLTALLVASLTSKTLPAAVFCVVHIDWLAVSSIPLLGAVLTPIVAGFIGIRRDERAESGPVRLPAFVRRIEDESRLQHELQLLARMQIGLLPQQTPRIDGYQFAAKSILAHEAGGDLYDFDQDQNGHLWIAAGDVSGHGYSCAIAQAMTKAGLTSLLDGKRTPAEVLQRLHHVLRHSGSPRTFTTLALLRLDPATGEVVFSNAAHPYAVLLSATGSLREIALPSLPLGQGPERTYSEATASLEIGSSIILASDGLFEALNPHGEAYGFERLGVLANTLAAQSAEGILDAIIADWRQHLGPLAPADDTTIVVVQRS